MTKGVPHSALTQKTGRPCLMHQQGQRLSLPRLLQIHALVFNLGVFSRMALFLLVEILAYD